MILLIFFVALVSSKFTHMVNNLDYLPNKKCVQNYTKKSQLWKCIFDVFALEFTSAKFLWLTSQYDEYVLRSIVKQECVTKGKFQFTLTTCRPEEVASMDFWRAMLIQGILQPLVEQGHSVWSNACIWSSGLGRSQIYFSEANKVIRGKDQ